MMIIHDGFDNDLGERAMRQAGIGDSDHHEDDHDQAYQDDHGHFNDYDHAHFDYYS